MNNKVRKIMIFVLMSLLIGISITQLANAGNLLINKSNNENIESVNNLRNIMLTGYWNPTGKMIAQFSTDIDLNPDGWKGENWEGRGYNIHSFFPDPDDNYSGDFEVDYQDTWEDFWEITVEIKPIAIISFGAGNGPWEIEYNARNLDSWIPDNNPPTQPTPSPPDDTVPVGYVRHSTLPVQEIADAVNDQTDIYAWVDWNGNPGAYLCEYMAYLGMWYQDIHNNSEDPFRCWEAGFIHVKSTISVPDAEDAAEITLREVIKSIPIPPGKPSIEGPTNGDVGVEYPYTFVSIDPEGEMVSYYIDWGDGEFEEWVGPFPSGQEETFNHAWTEIGSYDIKAKARNINNVEGDWSDNLTVNISHPPSAPDINGQNKGSPGILYEFGFTSTDPDGEDIAEYIIDWDDGSPDEIIIGPFASGEEAKTSHIWASKGRFVISAKAKDINGLIGPEATFPIDIPRNRVSFRPVRLKCLEMFPIIQRILTFIL